MVERLFLAVPRGCLQFVIVVFPDHTHLLFLKFHLGSILGQHMGMNSKSESQSWFARHLPTNFKPTRWEDKIQNRETQSSRKRDIHQALQIRLSSGMVMGESIQMKI